MPIKIDKTKILSTLVFLFNKQMLNLIYLEYLYKLSEAMAKRGTLVKSQSTTRQQARIKGNGSHYPTQICRPAKNISGSSISMRPWIASASNWRKLCPWNGFWVSCNAIYGKLVKFGKVILRSHIVSTCHQGMSQLVRICDDSCLNEQVLMYSKKKKKQMSGDL